MVMMEMGNTLEEMDNKKILIVGNGFDLAHNLNCPLCQGHFELV